MDESFVGKGLVKKAGFTFSIIYDTIQEIHQARLWGEVRYGAIDIVSIRNMCHYNF
jgi:hypothetical protein